MKIGLAQINTTVGDLAGNQQLIASAYKQLLTAGAELVVFPELSLCGYPPRDLLFKRRFVADMHARLQTLAQQCGSVPALIGFVEAREPNKTGRPYFNSLAWCENGQIQSIARKMLLPNYDVFDEARYFEAAQDVSIVQWKGLQIGLTICEDIWAADPSLASVQYSRNPLEILSQSKIDLLINQSASPWHRGKTKQRSNLIQAAAQKCQCPIVYCNAIGGNDELIFDGNSQVWVPDSSSPIAQMPAFEASLEIVDITSKPTKIKEPIPAKHPMAATERALILGLRDYAHKSGFKQALIGLSGGIDSAVVAALAARALGPENCIGVALPSAISSEHSRQDAAELAHNLGIQFHELPIAATVAAAEESLQPIFEDLPLDVTEENLQARTRGLLLMALSNKLNALLLTTGNKSELAVGYCTLYGDMCGGLALISDVPKMDVYALARYLNREDIIIPINTIDKPPSAELRPDQKDSDSLPDYGLLDAILERYVERGWSAQDIIADGFEGDLVRSIIRMVDRNEYKRKQAAPGLKTTPLAFGVGRRMPIVQKYSN